MIFGGIQKNSLIDYPGKISCVLFVPGCNFDCPYCHNPDLAKGCDACPIHLQEQGIFDFLAERKGFLDGVVISGGEPTLHGDLEGVCGRIKEMGYPVKLDTNGSRPGVVNELIGNGLVDYLAMDIKTDPFRYAPLIRQKPDPKDLLASIELIKGSGLPYEFKTTCIKPLVDAEIIENICMLIQGAKLYALQQFHHTRVLRPEFFEDENRIYPDRELMRFKAIAAPHVERCIVRL